MKQIITAILILVCTNLYGQIEEYLDYQKQINEAELNLVRGDKNKALNTYYLALTTSNGNFCKDIYNSLLLSSELSKVDTFFTLIDLLLPKGLDNTSIVDNEVFEKFQSDNRWNVFLEKNSKYPKRNKALKIAIDSLAIKDQEFRVVDGSYKVYRDTIRKIDSSNMEYLYALISSNKFPGENIIGVDNFAGVQGYDIVFHHYTQSTSRDEKKDKITPLIVNLVLQGKILPNKASHWLEMQNGEFTAGVFDILNFDVNGEQTNYYVPNYSKRKKIIINEYRKWLGMESLDEYYEKFLYTVNNPESKYIFDIPNNTFAVDENMFNKFTSNMKELK